jgi:hypothetical protein
LVTTVKPNQINSLTKQGYAGKRVFKINLEKLAKHLKIGLKTHFDDNNNATTGGDYIVICAYIFYVSTTIH